MDTRSLWTATSPSSPFPPLRDDLHADVVIAGGGITGVTAAMLLAEAGKSVVLLEARQVGAGTTGYSTGNVYAGVDSFLYRIAEKWGKEVLKEVVLSRRETVQRIEQMVSAHRISCGFRRCPHYFFPTGPAQSDSFVREREAMRDAGLDPVTEQVPLPFGGPGLKIEDQAQLQPFDYVQGLAKAIAPERCRIFENSRVEEIDYGSLTVTTRQGSVTAEHIVLATHTPAGFNLVQTEIAPYREYAVAAELQGGEFPEGIFWTMEEPSHSIRSWKKDGKSWLVAIGEKHKTGQHDPHVDYFARVEAFARSRFSLGEVGHRWSAQHYRSADHLPYIGRTAASPSVYIATGFETDGLVYGSLAAFIITGSILGSEHPREGLYRALRVEPLKGGKELLAENINVAGQYARDYLTRQWVEPEQISPGDGGMVQVKGEKFAVHRGEEGLAVVSAVCTHLGCIVHWNALEKSWDCPCHGSRFLPDGEVIEGPALHPLEKKELPRN